MTPKLFTPDQAQRESVGARARLLYLRQGDKLRFLLAGVLNTALGYGLFALLLFLLDEPLRSLSDSNVPSLAFAGAHYYLAVQWLNWIICVPPNTLAMKYLAFRTKGSWLRQVGRGYLVYLPVQILSFLVLWGTVRGLHLKPLLGQLVAIAVALVATYAGHKYFTFRAPGQGASGPTKPGEPETVSRPRPVLTGSRLLVFGLFAAIFVFRLAWLLIFEPHAVVKDAVLYDNAAKWFLDSGSFAVNATLNPSAWVVPGYSFFLSIVYWLFGAHPGNLLAVRIIQVILSVLSIALLYRVALRLQGRRLAVTCAVLAGLYPSFLLANEYVLTEVPYTFLLCLVVLFGVRLLDKPSWVNAVTLGVLLAVSAYVRPPGCIWGVLPFLFLLGKARFKRVLALGAVALVAFCLCMSPWWIRNGRIYDRFVPFTTNTGFTMIRGTYEMFGPEGYNEFLPSMISRDDLLSPEQELNANAYYQDLAVDRIGNQLRTEPGKFIWGRVKATADSYATPTYPSLSSYSHSHPTLAKGIVWAFRGCQTLVVLVPAAVALWLRRRDRRVFLLGSLPVLIGLIYATMLILPRYVFPVMPVMLLLASISWLALADWALSRRRAKRGRQRSSPES